MPPILENVHDVSKRISVLYENVSGVEKRITQGWINENGVAKIIYNSLPSGVFQNRILHHTSASYRGLSEIDGELWIANWRGPERIYRFNLSGISLGAFLLNIATDLPMGAIEINGHFWVLYASDGSMSIFNLDDRALDETYSNFASDLVPSLEGRDFDVPGFQLVNGEIWIIYTPSRNNDGNDRIIRYQISDVDNERGVVLGSFDLHVDNVRPSGIGWFENEVWITDSDSNEVFRYDLLGNYLSKWNLHVDNDNPVGIWYDSENHLCWVVQNTIEPDVANEFYIYS